MSRKKFIQSNGADCKNFNWAWSFVNHDKKFVIFGECECESEREDGGVRIFSISWERNKKGRRQSAFSESYDHINLIEYGGYALKTYKISYDSTVDPETGRARISNFERIINDRILVRRGDDWLACDEVSECHELKEGDGIAYPDDVAGEVYMEGATKEVVVNAFERNAKARRLCIEKYGTKCSVCDFDFSEKYGEIGHGYIHVHHLVPLSEIRAEYEVDPINDLRPVCANCHSMLHINVLGEKFVGIEGVEKLREIVLNNSTQQL